MATTRDDYEGQYAQFTEQIAEHEVSILRDDGLYRHIRCRRPGTYSYAFDIITWPGHLCYTGDVGCYVFSRLPDMFEFFRAKNTAIVDRQYIAEKTLAVDKPDGLRHFSERLFRAAIEDDFKTYAEDLDEDARKALWSEIEDDVLARVPEGRDEAVRAAMDFTHNRRSVFTDFYFHNLDEFATRFWWCCYAIPWAINKYDAMKVWA